MAKVDDGAPGKFGMSLAKILGHFIGGLTYDLYVVDHGMEKYFVIREFIKGDAIGEFFDVIDSLEHVFEPRAVSNGFSHR